MTAIVLLFVVGALLLAAEVMLPGAIAGIIGGVALALGSVLAFLEYGPGIGSLATFAALLLLAAMLYAELIWLPRTRLGRAMVVDAAIDGQSQPPPATSEVVGQKATAVTPLSPTGLVTIGEKRYEAFCRSGFVARGAELEVVGLDNFRVVVSETKHP